MHLEEDILEHIQINIQETKKRIFVKRCEIAQNEQVLKEVKFTNKDYRELKPKNMLIYCDPPYKETTYPIKYRRDIKYYDKFDNDEFWEIMRIWSKNNIVIISETSAPTDFIWEKEISRSASKSKNNR